MEQTRPAPTQIPAGAVWNPELEVWEVSHRDQHGARQGECQLFRPDGTLLEVCHYHSDVRNGPFLVYHPNGEIARRGSFSAGLVDGSVRAFASDGPTTESLRTCCVPDNAWELRARYARGNVLLEVFHDREGRPLLATGALRPDPPAGVPPEADLDESDERWVLSATDDAGNRGGTRQSWTLDGRLAEVDEFREGRLTSSRVYQTERDSDDDSDADGDGNTPASTPRVLAELHYAGEEAAERVLHGPYRRRFSAEANPYADPRIREERGAFDRGSPVGPWHFLDAAGAVLGRAELGTPLDEEGVTASPAFAWQRAEAVSAAIWWTLAERLRSDGRVREALCAAARGAARQGDAADLAAFLGKHTVALAPEVRQQRGTEISGSSDQTLASALDALVTGVDPAAGFRAIASVLESAHPAALDFADASLLLGPEHRMTHLTRAFIRIEQGDDRGALADAEKVELESPDTARSLREHLRRIYPDFSSRGGFWPARETLESEAIDEQAPGTSRPSPAQPLSAVRHVAQIYATRLGRVRATVRERIGRRLPDPIWLPPELSNLLPDGPVALHRLTTTLPPGDGSDARGDLDQRGDVDQGEATEVQIDEELGVGNSDRPSVADLLTTARADWSALGWLCWACGLDRVALPDRLAPPPAFASAVAMSVARCFRAQDRMITGGVRGLAQGLPGFVWEGIDIDEMPNHFARIAAAEYLEVRSMFLWLILPDALSPFQSDLRDA